MRQYLVRRTLGLLVRFVKLKYTLHSRLVYMVNIFRGRIEYELIYSLRGAKISMQPTINDAWGAEIKAVKDTPPKQSHKVWMPDKFYHIPFSCIFIDACSVCKCHKKCFEGGKGFFRTGYFFLVKREIKILIPVNS